MNNEIILANLEMFTAFARKRLHNPELAADAVQDALLKALHAADTPKEQEKLIPWFYQILRRTIFDLYRRNDVRRRAQDKIKTEIEVFGLAEVEAGTVCECFRSLLPALPSQYSTLLQSVDLDGRRNEDVARDLKISPNALNVKLFRARKALRKSIEALCKACSKHGCLDCTCGDNSLHPSRVH